MRRLVRYVVVGAIVLAGCSLVNQDLAAAQEGAAERMIIATAYRYVAEETEAGEADTGQALCGIRCNALSVDYQNYLTPPGWRLIKVAAAKEVQVDLANPFLAGRCICVADEYLIRKNELYMSKVTKNGERK